MFTHNIFQKIWYFLKRIMYLFQNKKQSESMKVYKNVDVVQINLKSGTTEYFLPKNVDWADKVIDKIVVYTPSYQMLERSPIDGRSAICDREFIKNLYFDFYNKEDEAIARNLSLSTLMFTNNNPIELNSKLSLHLSRVFAAGELSEDGDGCLLLYVYYNTKEVDDYEDPKHNVTVRFNIESGTEIPLSDVIDTYIHAQGAKLKGLYAWGKRGSNTGLFITLRNRNYETIVKDYPLELCKAPMGWNYSKDNDMFYSKAERIQTNPFYLDDEDIDFANSTLKCTPGWGEEDSVTITFLY